MDWVALEDVRKVRDRHWLFDYEHFVAIARGTQEGGAAIPDDAVGTDLRLIRLVRPYIRHRRPQ